MKYEDYFPHSAEEVLLGAHSEPQIITELLTRLFLQYRTRVRLNVRDSPLTGKAIQLDFQEEFRGRCMVSTVK
jgi:hypothetical protein